MNASNTWRPSASMDALRQRARVMAGIRDYFTSRGFLEVETPIMARFSVTDPHLASFKVHCHGHSYALQTSPEYHMKRFLAAGSGPIFQIARVFRDDELGRWHNPEFSLLEWYQLGCTHLQLLKEVDLFLQFFMQAPPLRVLTYQQVFIEWCGFDPLVADVAQIRHALAKWELDNVLPSTETEVDVYLHLLMSHVVEPGLALISEPIAVIDFPASQASLACINEGVAERFEVYYRGVELANGFHELTDASLQAARFEHDVITRDALGLPAQAPDEYLLAALQHGLPPCSGVALGIDRLMAICLKQSDIASTLTFDFSRA